MKLTDEQKKRMAPAIVRAWCAVADDAGRVNLSNAVEIACDAGRPVTYGKMTPEDDRALGEAYHDKDTKKWLRGVLRGYV